MNVAAMLGLVACIALNFWLFRLETFWGIVGLNITKHVAIAYLVRSWASIGVDRRSACCPQTQSPAYSGRLNHASTHG